MKHTILLLFLLGTLLVAQTWHVPQAELRIRFSRCLQNTQHLLLPVPAELAKNIRDIRAVDDNGTVLPASAVRVGNTILAAAVDTTALKQHRKKDKPGTLTASVYLMTEKDPAPVPFTGEPVTFCRTVKTLTTRAHSHVEMLRMFANLCFIPYPQRANTPRKNDFQYIEIKSLQDFGEHAELAAVPQAKREHDIFTRSFSCATTAFLLEKNTRIAFSTTQPHVAWTILVDAVPVANWTDEGTPLPRWHELPPGIHTLQMLAVQTSGEPLPLPLVQFDEKQKPAPLTNLLPANRPIALGLEAKSDKNSLTALSLLPIQTVTFAQTADTLTAYAATPTQGTYAISCLDSANRPLAFTNILLAADCLQPAIRFSDSNTHYTFFGLRLWRPETTSIHISARLSSPVYQDAHQPIPLTLTVDTPEYVHDYLKKLLVISVNQLRSDGTPACPAMHTQTPTHQLELAPSPAPQARRMVISGTIGNAKAFQDITLALIYPNDAHIPLRAQGKQLFLEHKKLTYATMFANDLPVTAPHNRPPQEKNVLFDDFLLTTQAPGADSLPAPPMKLLAASTPHGTEHRLATAVALHRLLAEKPTTAFILASPRPFDTIGELALKTAANACRTHGIHPVIVILPPLHDVSPAVARNTAFALKTWAIQQDLQTRDLYTKALLEAIQTTDWHTANGINIATINNAARQWLYKQLQ